jgi:hypothetical protein
MEMAARGRKSLTILFQDTLSNPLELAKTQNFYSYSSKILLEANIPPLLKKPWQKLTMHFKIETK